MATKLKTSKGHGKSTRAKLIALLQHEPQTVEQICKRLDISAAHARTELRNVEARAQRTLTLYSLPRSK